MSEQLFPCWRATHVAELRNGALNHRTAATPAPGSTTLTLTRPALVGLVTGTVTIDAATADGTVSDLERLVGLLAPVDPDFAIVTP